jgi:hypothetical protein
MMFLTAELSEAERIETTIIFDKAEKTGVTGRAMSYARKRLRIVTRTDSKAAEYLRCDAYWLLIIVDWRDNAQDQEISVKGVRIVSEVLKKL